MAPGISKQVNEGDVIEANVETGDIVNTTQHLQFHAEPSPPFLLDMLKAGGLIPYVAKSGFAS